MKQQTFLTLFISLGLLALVGFGTYMVIEESQTAEDRAAVERLMREQQHNPPEPIDIEPDEEASDSANPTTDQTTESEQDLQLELESELEDASTSVQTTF